jgi:hypothetical protein
MKQRIIFEAKPLFDYLFDYCRKQQLQQYSENNNMTSMSFIYMNNVARCLDMLVKMKQCFKRMTKNYEPFLFDVNIKPHTEYVFSNNQRYSITSSLTKSISYLRIINGSLTPETAEEFEPFYLYFYKKAPEKVRFKLGYHGPRMIRNCRMDFFKVLQIHQSFITYDEQIFIWNVFIKDIPLIEYAKNLPVVGPRAFTKWINTGDFDMKLCRKRNRKIPIVKPNVNLRDIFKVAESEFGKDCLLEYGPVLFTEDVYFDPIYDYMPLNRDDYYDIMQKIEKNKNF